MYGACGNQSFTTRAEMDEFIAKEHRNWRTYSRWLFTPDSSGVSQLYPILD